MTELLAAVIAAVEEEGEALRAEFHRPEGPRGRGGSAPIDTEMETRLVAKLQALVPCAFAGEETGRTPAAAASHGDSLWLVDPHDGTYEFLQGRRGSAVSVALLKGGKPALAVVCSPLSPDRGRDTIAWEEGESILRNGVALKSDISKNPPLVWATASSAFRPATFSRAVLPCRYVAMPSIAYRLARVAAGDGVATLSTHPVNEYDFAAGLALVQAAGGVLIDAEGRGIGLAGDPERRVSGLFAGSREAVSRLQAFPWKQLDEEPRRGARVSLGYPRKPDEARRSRAAGCLAGAIAGESLRAAREYRMLPGQPADAGEMLLILSRILVREKRYEAEKARSAYRDWLQTRPVDVGATTERGLLGLHTTESESNGSLARVAPLGIWAAGDPARAAAAAREDGALTHPNPVCQDACAAYAAAIAAGVGGGDARAMSEAALAQATGAVREAVANARLRKADGSAVISLGNAFASLGLEFEEALGLAADHNDGAIVGALLGAARGREAIPPLRILDVLACRPIAEAGALRPRPMEYWPDDVLELAEALLQI